MDALILRVAARYHRQVASAYIPAKWFKEKKAELHDILKTPLRDDPDSWDYPLNWKVYPFFDKFQKDFEALITFDQAIDSIRGRVKSAKDYVEALAAKVRRVGGLKNDVDFKNPASYLQWYAVRQCHDKMAATTKTIGDLFKYEWFISEDVIDRLVKKAIRLGTPEEIAALTEDDPQGRYHLKYAFLDRVGFGKAALRALKKSKLDSFDPSKWVDRMFEMLSANYSERAIEKQDAFREFDLQGMKVVIDDRTVGASDIKKYVQYLSEAHRLLKAKGLEEVWYGIVFIQCDNCGGINYNTGIFGDVGGWFDHRPDAVTVFERPSDHTTKLMIHELGHRYWFKHLDSEQRARFSDLVKTHTVPHPLVKPKATPDYEREAHDLKVKIDHIEAEGLTLLKEAKKVSLLEVSERVAPKFMNEGLSADVLRVMSTLEVSPDLEPDVHSLKDDPRKMQKRLDDRAKEIKKVKAQDLDEMRRWVFDVGMLFNELVAQAHIFVDAVVSKKIEQDKKDVEPDEAMKAWEESYEKNPRPVVPVSDYGKSNPAEAFAEVFAYYVLGKDLTRDQIESFRSVLSSIVDPLPALIVKRYLAAPRI